MQMTGTIRSTAMMMVVVVVQCIQCIVCLVSMSMMLIVWIVVDDAAATGVCTVSSSSSIVIRN